VTRALLTVADPRAVRTFLAALLRPYRGRAGAALVALVLAAATALAPAPLLGRIVDLVVDGSGVEALTGPVLLLALAAVVQGAFTVVGSVLVAEVGETMLADLRERFLGRAVRLPLGRLEDAGHGDLTSRVTTDVALVGAAVRDAVPEFARAVLTVSLTVVALAVLDWRFLIVAAAVAPVHVLATRWYLRRSGALYAEQRRVAGAQQQQWLDTVGGLSTVRAFDLTPVHAVAMRERSDDVVTLAMRLVRFRLRFFTRLNVGEFLGTAGVLAVGFWLVRGDLASVGTASAAALYVVRLFNPIAQVLYLLDTAQDASASLARLVGVAELPTAVRAGTAPPRRDDGIVVERLDHAYVAGHPVLTGIDLTVPAGTTVALVGASGAGKTTLAGLLAGVHTPSTGTVRLGGVPTTELDESALRATVALVSQEVHVFAGPLRDDLRLAAPDASEADLREALAAVEALGWVRALPAGLDTVVGGGGSELTVVQAQQLALARVLLADRPIVVLDEATAEAGSAGSRVLERAAARVLAGRTGVLVAHRLSQASGADLVVVLDAGRIVEQGAHDGLVAAGGPYARLWSAWSGRDDG
jgi:ATP-binding cassette, subfamily C, bacterial